MNDNAMKVAMVIDRSGSMSQIKEATVEGLNAFWAEQRTAPTEVSVLIVQFDDRYEKVFSGALKDVPTFTLAANPAAGEFRFEPRGWTALLDAIGMTINEVGKELAELSEEQRPGRVVVVIITDGGENASRNYTHSAVAAMIAHQRDVYKWEFQFLGANQDAIQTGQGINIPMANSVTYAASAVGTQSVIRAAARNVRAYGATGQSVYMNFSGEDRVRAMDTDDAQPSVFSSSNPFGAAGGAPSAVADLSAKDANKK